MPSKVHICRTLWKNWGCSVVQDTAGGVRYRYTAYKHDDIRCEFSLWAEVGELYRPLFKSFWKVYERCETRVQYEGRPHIADQVRKRTTSNQGQDMPNKKYTAEELLRLAEGAFNCVPRTRLTGVDDHRDTYELAASIGRFNRAHPKPEPQEQPTGAHIISQGIFTLSETKAQSILADLAKFLFQDPGTGKIDYGKDVSGSDFVELAVNLLHPAVKAAEQAEKKKARATKKGARK